MKNYSWGDLPRPTAFPIAKPGYPVIFACAFTTFVFALLGMKFFTLTALAITFFVCFFFRDPDRVTPGEPHALISPADGKIVYADTVEEDTYFQGTCKKISIFMSVFNVHVNRIPHDGKIGEISYHPGKFFSANLDKASKENEHNALFIETRDGLKYCVVQIAGLIARRIICNTTAGESVIRGQRFGMICFGSRLDVYLPVESRFNVKVGERVKAGTSILGYFK
ncbi:MAG: phosphatidylserine decarboxylase family protein [Deltaproteobacteria bacterium]|nr:phosphatidylserine decarboxylase family protein [Deltaproteobacteria bacterium]